MLGSQHPLQLTEPYAVPLTAFLFVLCVMTLCLQPHYGGDRGEQLTRAPALNRYSHGRSSYDSNRNGAAAVSAAFY